VVRVSIEVRSGAARFDVAVQAESIQRALTIVGAHHPGSDVRVRFPIDPETFFVNDPAAPTGLIDFGKRERSAA
jgi:hypothetical protein